VSIVSGSASGEVTAELVDVGLGRPQDFEARDVAGAARCNDTIIGSDLPQSGSSLPGDQGDDTIVIPLGHQAINSHTAVRRSTLFTLPPDVPLRTCSAEDLIVFKAFADRLKDWVERHATP
jgi:hypothetical protein